jgi:hypothetical protein
VVEVVGVSVVVAAAVVGVVIVDATVWAVVTEGSPAVLEQAVVTKAARTRRNSESWSIGQSYLGSK